MALTETTRRSADLWIPTILLLIGLILVAGVLLADEPRAAPAPAGDSPERAAPSSGEVKLSEEERAKRRISLYSHELSRDYHGATYNFYFASQGNEVLTLNDWDLRLTGWKPPYEFDVHLVTDDRSGIRDLGAIDYLGYRPRGKALEKIPAELDRATVHPGHVYLIYTKDDDAEYWSKVKVVSIDANGRAEILGEVVRVKRRPIAGAHRRA